LKLLRHILGIRSSLLPEGIAVALAQMACDQIMVPSRRPGVGSMFSRTLERERPGDREGYDAGSGEGAGGETEGGEVFLPLNWTTVRIS
jgi:hypothetical protein